MSAAERARSLNITITSEQLRAFEYLERNGLRFCIDYGTANAVEIARQHWRERRRHRKRMNVRHG